MDTAVALQMIRGHTTLEFMKANVISIAGRPTAPPGEYYLTEVLRARDDKHAKFSIKFGVPGGTRFFAHSVPMVNRGTFGSIATCVAVNLPNDGPDLAMTGQLTACSFVFSQDKKNMWCTHLEPRRGTQTGIELDTEATNAASFINAPVPVLVCGQRSYAHCHHINLLGVRRMDGWTFYIQGIDASGTISFATAIN